MKNPGKSHSRLSELDALRGIAVLLVITFHITMFYDNIAIRNIFKYGMTGVHLFFIISGFVIFMSLNNIRSGKDFIIHRFARLYPIYWVCLSLTFLLHLYDNISSHEPATIHYFYNYLANLTMLQFYFNVRNLDDPYWSLVVELLFYVLIFTIYKLKLLKFTEYIFFCLVFFELIVLLLHLIYPLNTKIVDIEAAADHFPLSHFLPLFLTGIVFYRIYSKGGKLIWFLIIITCFVTQVLEYPNMIVSIFKLGQLQFAITLAVYYILFALFVDYSLKFIVNSVTIFLGRISYALYLFHQYLVANFVIPKLAYEAHFPYWLSCVIALILVIFIAAINTVYIDEPIRNWIKKSYAIRDKVFNKILF